MLVHLVQGGSFIISSSYVSFLGIDDWFRGGPLIQDQPVWFLPLEFGNVPKKDINFPLYDRNWELVNVGAIGVVGTRKRAKQFGNERDEWDKHPEKENRGVEKNVFWIAPVLLQSVADCISYLLLCSKLTQNEMTENNSLYYPTASASQESRQDLIGSSVSGSLRRLQSGCWPRLWFHLKTL